MKFDIVNIEEFSGGMAQIYSVMFEGDDMTLMDHFFEDNAQYSEELEEMAKKLESMGNDTGCRIQFLKRMKASQEMEWWHFGIKECGYIACESEAPV